MKLIAILYYFLLGMSLDLHYEYEYETGRRIAGSSSPLMQQLT